MKNLTMFEVSGTAVMNEANPYQSPQTLSGRNSRRSPLISLAVRAAPWSVVLGLLLASLPFMYRAYELKNKYPNLEDHSPNVDWYWPHVAHLVNWVVVFLLVGAAVIVAFITLLVQITAQTKDRK